MTLLLVIVAYIVGIHAHKQPATRKLLILLLLLILFSTCKIVRFLLLDDWIGGKPTVTLKYLT
jgi:UPF0716 family protein affecting phage T7 exclusion